MRKIRALFFLLMVGMAGTPVFTSGYPVLDIANLMNNIEELYQFYQQIQQTIEQVQNTYRQIEQAAQQVQGMNWDDLKNLGDNFSGMSDNPFEVITGVRNSAQDITAAVNKNMNRVNELRNALQAESISFGGVDFSVADLCGASGKEDKNVFGFALNAWEYTHKKAAEAAKGYAGKLTYDQRRAIMRKYGMSAENYATTEIVQYQLDNLVQDSNISATTEAIRKKAEQVMAEAELVKKMADNTADGDVKGLSQLQVKTTAMLLEKSNEMTAAVEKQSGLFSNWIFTNKAREELEKQIAQEEKSAAENSVTGSSIQNYDDM